MPKGFFPQQDTGRLSGTIQADQDSSFEATKARTLKFAALVLKDPAVDTVQAYVGGGTLNTGRMFISLKPLEERGISTDGVISRLRARASSVPGAVMLLQSVQDVRVGGRASAAQYQYTLQGDNVKDLNDWAPRVYAMLRTLPELRDVNSDQQKGGLQASLTIDRQTAARLGITPQVIDNTLYDAFGQRPVSTMYTQLNQYHVVMEVEPRFWQSPDGLRYTYLHGSDGQPVPLAAVAHYEPSTAPLTINHQGQFPAITMSFNLREGTALGTAVDRFRLLGAASDFPRPFLAASREPHRPTRRRSPASSC